MSERGKRGRGEEEGEDWRVEKGREGEGEGEREKESEK